MGNKVGYKGQIVYLDKDPRTGICNLCRAVLGEVNAQRDKTYRRGHHIHHESYHDDNPLKDTIEFCPSCHRVVENQKGLARGGIYNKHQPRTKVVRVLQETYDRLKKRGQFGMDFDDVVTKVLDDLEKCEEHKGRHG